MEVLKMEVLRMEKISIPQMLYKFPNTSNCHWNPWKHLCWQKVFPGAKSLITGNPGENYSKKNELICSFPIKKKQATCWLDLPDNESTNERANERTNERKNKRKSDTTNVFVLKKTTKYVEKVQRKSAETAISDIFGRKNFFLENRTPPRFEHCQSASLSKKSEKNNE